MISDYGNSKARFLCKIKYLIPCTLNNLLDYFIADIIVLLFFLKLRLTGCQKYIKLCGFISPNYVIIILMCIGINIIIIEHY